MACEGEAVLQIAEIKEFATFSKGAQRYIRISLDIHFQDAMVMDKWSRTVTETGMIAAQERIYKVLPTLRSQMPVLSNSDIADEFMGGLVRVSTFDLLQGKISSFNEYRFLYERLLGAAVRPWLPSAYCAAAAMPQIDYTRRKLLLQSISEAAATAPGWSDRAPTFFPEWVDKVPQNT